MYVYDLRYSHNTYSFLSFGHMMAFRRYCMTQMPERVGTYKRRRRF